jgi:hypothetical protein
MSPRGTRLHRAGPRGAGAVPPQTTARSRTHLEGPLAAMRRRHGSRGETPPSRRPGPGRGRAECARARARGGLPGPPEPPGARQGGPVGLRAAGGAPARLGPVNWCSVEAKRASPVGLGHKLGQFCTTVQVRHAARRVLTARPTLRSQGRPLESSLCGPFRPRYDRWPSL